MTHRLSSRIVLAAACTACLATACTALSPAGNAGWNAARRERELARASSLAAPAAAPGRDAAPSTAAPLDLASALDLAGRRNRSIAAASASVNAAAGDVAAVRAALLPTAGIRGGYNWYSDDQTNSIVLDPSLLPPGTAIPSVTVREQDFANVTAAVRLAIDLGGELRHSLDAAQASYRAEAARAWATHLDEEKNVAAAYYGLLEAERLREVGQQTVTLYERQLADASIRYEQGRLTRNGVLVVQVTLTDARQVVLQLENAVAIARRALNVVTGLDVSAATEVREVAGRPSLPSLDDAVAKLKSANPVVTSLLEEVNAADERLTSAKRARLPRFSLTAAYDATTAKVLTPNDYASVGVGVEMDLVNLRREGEIARLGAVATRTRLVLDRTTRDLEKLLRDSHDRLRERLAAIDAARSAVGQAEENMRIRRVQFDEGRATSEDLLQASQLLVRQKAMLAASLYQAHERRAELQQLMGRPLAELAADPAPQGGSPR